jgi:hypothetical protein
MPLSTELSLCHRLFSSKAFPLTVPHHLWRFNTGGKEEEEEDDDDEGEYTEDFEAETKDEDVNVDAGGTEHSCRCGSFAHVRVTSGDCPLNPKNNGGRPPLSLATPMRSSSHAVSRSSRWDLGAGHTMGGAATSAEAASTSSATLLTAENSDVFLQKPNFRGKQQCTSGQFMSQSRRARVQGGC